MRVAYLDPFSGVSGDLCLGALVDVGVPIDDLQSAVDRLGVDGLSLTAGRVERGGIVATKVDVTYPEQQEHRHLQDIVSLLESSSLSERVRRRAVRVFRRLAEVEAGVHGVETEDVHFHEVGAADALADVIGTVAGLEALEVERLVVGTVNVGSGSVRCAHGVLPVPAPATLGLLKGWRCRVAGPVRELTTPTGAALITVLGSQVDALPEMRIERSGHGAGGADFPDWPNVLRLVVGEV